jgi:hypothetical protein
VPDPCEGGKEPSGSTRGGGAFFDQLSYHQLLKKGCASLSHLPASVVTVLFA